MKRTFLTLVGLTCLSVLTGCCCGRGCCGGCGGGGCSPYGGAITQGAYAPSYSTQAAMTPMTTTAALPGTYPAGPVTTTAMLPESLPTY